MSAEADVPLGAALTSARSTDFLLRPRRLLHHAGFGVGIDANSGLRLTLECMEHHGACLQEQMLVPVKAILVPLPPAPNVPLSY